MSAETIRPVWPHRSAAHAPSAHLATPRGLVPLVVAPLLGVLVFIAPAPLFPAMARDLDASVPLLGQIVTVMLLLSAVLGLVVGPLADRHGHRRLLLLGALASSGCLIGFGLAPSVPALLVAALLGGLGAATLPGLSLAVAGADFSGAARRRAIGWATAGGAGAGVVGVPLLAAIAGTAGWRMAFVAAGLAALAVAWAFGTGSPRAPRVPSGSPPIGTLMTAYRPLLSHGPTLRLLWATVLRSVSWAGLSTYIGILLVDELGLNPSAVGVAYAFGGGGYLVGSLTAGRLLERFPPRALLAVSTAGLAPLIGLVASALLDLAGTVALLPLTGFLGAVSVVGVAALLAVETPAGMGTTMTLNGALTNLGSAVGGAVGGALLAIGGFWALSLGLPVFAALGGVLVWRRGAPVPSAAHASG